MLIGGEKNRDGRRVYIWIRDGPAARGKKFAVGLYQPINMCGLSEGLPSNITSDNTRGLARLLKNDLKVTLEEGDTVLTIPHVVGKYASDRHQTLIEFPASPTEILGFMDEYIDLSEK